MKEDTEKRVRLYISLGYAPSQIDRILDLPKGETKKVLMKIWKQGLKV